MSIVNDAKADLSLPITVVNSYEDANARVKANGSNSDGKEGGDSSGVSIKPDKVIVPEWRSKSYTVSYKLEGIEVGLGFKTKNTVRKRGLSSQNLFLCFEGSY